MKGLTWEIDPSKTTKNTIQSVDNAIKSMESDMFESDKVLLKVMMSQYVILYTDYNLNQVTPAPLTTTRATVTNRNELGCCSALLFLVALLNVNLSDR